MESNELSIEESVEEKYTTRYLGKDEYDKWDEFVQKSPQGTIFSSSKWLEIITSLSGEFKILTCYKGDELIGGISFVERKEKRFKYIFIPKFTPYGGILCKDPSSLSYKKRITLQRDVANTIIPELIKTYDKITMAHHISYEDIRPFTWNNFTHEVRYTYIINIEDLSYVWDNMESTTIRNIKKARKENIEVTPQEDIDEFYQLYEVTYKKQGLQPSSPELMANVYTKLKSLNQAQMYFARDVNRELIAGVFIVTDNKRAYYLFGASHPTLRSSGGASLTFWTVFEHLSGKIKELDLVGANTPSIEKFKRGFGGELKHYFAVSKINSIALAISQNINEIKSRIKLFLVGRYK
ncbi:MAG: GNAT family N-acetyltransferase [bacterium]